MRNYNNSEYHTARNTCEEFIHVCLQTRHIIKVSSHTLNFMTSTHCNSSPTMALQASEYSAIHGHRHLPYMRIFSWVYMLALEIFVWPNFSANGMGTKNWLHLLLVSEATSFTKQRGILRYRRSTSMHQENQPTWSIVTCMLFLWWKMWLLLITCQEKYVSYACRLFIVEACSIQGLNLHVG